MNDQPQFTVTTHAPHLAPKPVAPRPEQKAVDVPQVVTIPAPPTARGGAAEPSTMELAANFAGAVGRWSAAGFPTVSAETYAARADACGACSFWDGKARLGLGKCRAPGCGCTGLKRWLTTETCPHPDGSRWPA